MKKLFPISIFCFLIFSFASATPVQFYTVSLTGSVNNRRILVTADQTPYPPISGTNLLANQQFYLQPFGGSVTTNLVPWGYTVQVEGWPRSVHIWVPDSASPVNVIGLINTNAFAPLNFYTGPLTINGGQSTNNPTYVEATNISAGAASKQGTANTNDTIARVTAQGAANTNDTIARVAASAATLVSINDPRVLHAQTNTIAGAGGISVTTANGVTTIDGSGVIGSGDGGGSSIWTTAGSTIYPGSSAGTDSSWTNTGSIIYPL